MKQHNESAKSDKPTKIVNQLKTEGNQQQFFSVY